MDQPDVTSLDPGSSSEPAPLNRRDFLTAASAAAAGVLIPTDAVTADATASVARMSNAPRHSFEALVPQLTLEETIQLLGGTGTATQAVERLGIPSFKMADGPGGIRNPSPSTSFGSGIGLAASWDVQLATEFGRQLGRDARSRGIHYLLGPGVNIYRAPMGGRNFEYFGEDPWLAGRIAAGYINGVQEQGVSATIKHFVGNDSDFARHTSDSTIDERALREIYLPVFETAVRETKVGAVMSSYNLTNGEHMSANAHLLRQVLKDEWGHAGVLMSDWGGTYDGIAAANAGLDLEMPVGQFMNRATLVAAVEAGSVSRATLLDKARRQLRLADRFQWGSRPGPDLSIPRYNVAGLEVAYRTAVEGTVLLKNVGSVLPLDRRRLKNLAVIGPLAHPTPASAGGSGHVPSFRNSSLLEGLAQKLGPSVSVTSARGLLELGIMNLITPFTISPSGPAGVMVDGFGDSALSGSPTTSRIERHFSTGTPPTGGDPELLNAADSLPPSQAQLLSEAPSDGESKPTYERWTGWFDPTAPGSYTLFVQAGVEYRLFLDGVLVLDNSRTRIALRQLVVTLTQEPHRVVFEQTSPPEIGHPFMRVSIQRNGAFVDPVAKKLAEQADVVVLALGFDPDTETEGADREFALPPGQDELVQEITAVNPNVVVVVVSGGAVDTRSWIDRVPALMAAWYPGQEGGRALADLLTGEANPSGRLPFSWEREPKDNPTFGNYHFNDAEHPQRVVYREGIFLGYRGYQRSGVKPLFPFGYGLSYTSFQYANLSIEPMASDPTAEATRSLYTVSFDVTNTGNRSGSEVAQIYVGDVKSKVPRPLRELKGFSRVSLDPGETRRLQATLDERSFAYYDTAQRAWQVDNGTYRVAVGRSSDDIAVMQELRLPRSHTVRRV